MSDERVRMRATINLQGLPAGAVALVDTDDPYIKSCIEREYLVAAPHGRMGAEMLRGNSEGADPDTIEHDPVPSDAETRDRDESESAVAPAGYEPPEEASS